MKRIPFSLSSPWLFGPRMVQLRVLPSAVELGPCLLCWDGPELSSSSIFPLCSLPVSTSAGFGTCGLQWWPPAQLEPASSQRLGKVLCPMASVDAAVIFQRCELFEDVWELNNMVGLAAAGHPVVGWMPSPSWSVSLETSFLLIDYDGGSAAVMSSLVKDGLTPFCELWKHMDPSSLA